MSEVDSIAQALAALPPACQRVIILIRWQGMNVEQVAAELRLPRRQVRKLWIQSLAHLQRAVGPIHASTPAAPPAKLEARIRARKEAHRTISVRS